VPHPQGAVGLGKRFCDVGRFFFAHHPPGLDPIGVEPGVSSAEKADHRWLLLIRQHLDLGKPCGVFHGDVNLS